MTPQPGASPHSSHSKGDTLTPPKLGCWHCFSDAGRRAIHRHFVPIPLTNASGVLPPRQTAPPSAFTAACLPTSSRWGLVGGVRQNFTQTDAREEIFFSQTNYILYSFWQADGGRPSTIKTQETLIIVSPCSHLFCQTQFNSIIYDDDDCPMTMRVTANQRQNLRKSASGSYERSASAGCRHPPGGKVTDPSLSLSLSP